MVLGMPSPFGLTRHGQEVEPVHLAIVEVVLQVIHNRAVGSDHVGGLRPEEVYNRGVFVAVRPGNDPPPYEPPPQRMPGKRFRVLQPSLTTLPVVVDATTNDAAIASSAVIVITVESHVSDHFRDIDDREAVVFLNSTKPRCEGVVVIVISRYVHERGYRIDHADDDDVRIGRQEHPYDRLEPRSLYTEFHVDH